MKYRLISLGKLKAGVSEQQAIPALMKLTKLPELMVRKKLLAGKSTALITSDDVTKVAAAKGRFAAIGLVVEVIEVEEPVNEPAKASSSPQKNKKTLKTKGPTKRAQNNKKKATSASLLKRIAWSLVLFVVFIAGAGGGLWYWLFMAKDANNDAVAAALITDQTAAVVHIDIQRLLKIDALLQTDITGLLGRTDSTNVATSLITMVDNKQLSLSHGYSAVIASAENQVDVLTVIVGDFTPQAWRTLFSPFYEMTDLASGLIQLLPKKPALKGEQCPSDVVQDAAPRFVKLSPTLVVFGTNEGALQRFENRLQNAALRSANLEQWQVVNQWSLASGMVFSPKNSSLVLPGIAGMIGGQLVQTQPDLNSVAFSVRLDPLKQGIKFQGSVYHDDPNWNSATGAAANTWLQTIRSDRNLTSEAFGQLLEQVNIGHAVDAVQVDWSVSRHSFQQIKQSLESAVASFFGGAFSVANADGEDINQTPQIYNRPVNLNQLPMFEVPSYGAQPLFVKGAFAFDVGSLRMLEHGFLELTVDAKAALPKLENDTGLGDLLRYSLVVNDVVNRQGESLLRDEHCVTDSLIFGSKNHQVETYGSAFFGQAASTKRLRLAKGTQVSDISQVTGEYRLEYPRQVQKLAIPLAAGAKVNFAQTSVEIIRLGERSVRYKVSGSRENLLEIRALNDQGQVLRQGWKSTFGKLEDQTYQGKIAALEVYITDGYNQTNSPFTLDDIFVKTGDEDDAVHPFALSYAPVQRAKWNLYQFVDMRLVRPIPDEWTPGESPRRALGNKAWPGVKMFVTQNPDSWDANPDAHVYLPLWGELYASMSSLSYQLAGKDKPEVFVPVRFGYQTNEGLSLVANQTVRQQPFGLVNFKLDASYQENEAFKGVQGKLSMRLPQRLQQQDSSFNDVWQTKSINGIDVTLDSVTRGGLAGYHFELRGDLKNLIAIHGVNDYGERIAPSSLNYQDDGYWTATIPFRDNLNKVRIVTAAEQDVFELPFNFTR